MLLRRAFKPFDLFGFDILVLFIPMRERKEDIPQLVNHFLLKHSEKLDRYGIAQS